MTQDILSSGVQGLDKLLNGGFPKGHVYLIRGEPGTGKTTMALQYLQAGREADEPGLYLTLSQTKEELAQIAEGYGINLGGVDIEDADLLFRSEDTLNQTVLKTNDVELEHLATRLRERLKRDRPVRVVLDSLIDLRLRCADVLAYRQLIRELISMFVNAGSTVMLLDSNPEYGGDSQIAALVHGVISLQRALPGYGIAQRRLEINKLRAVSHAEGLHDFTINGSGVRVFPRLSSAQELDEPTLGGVSTGLDELDELLGGGLEQGTACLIFGRSGTGKSTLSSVLLQAALERGETASLFLFEEHEKTYLQRAAGVGYPLQNAVDDGRLLIDDLRAGEVLPGQFVHRILDTVDARNTKIVVVDSINGYLTAAAHKDHALAQLNTLLTTLRSRQVVTLLIAEQTGLLDHARSHLDLSVLADTVVLLRQYEWKSNIRRSIAALKKRSGPHSTELRELIIEPGNVRIEPIAEEQLESLRYANLLTSNMPT